MNFLNKKLEADFIAFQHNVPNEKTKQRKLKDDSLKFHQLDDSYENWKNRGNNGKLKQQSSLFFNKKNL